MLIHVKLSRYTLLQKNHFHDSVWGEIVIFMTIKFAQINFPVCIWFFWYRKLGDFKSVRMASTWIFIAPSSAILTLFPLLNWNGPQSHLGPWLLVPEKFGPQEIWLPRNLVPTWKSSHGFFMRCPNFSGTKKVRGPNEIGDHFSYSP